MKLSSSKILPRRVIMICSLFLLSWEQVHSFVTTTPHSPQGPHQGSAPRVALRMPQPDRRIRKWIPPRQKREGYTHNYPAEKIYDIIMIPSPNDIWKSTKTAAADWWAGGMEVHERYLELQKKIVLNCVCCLLPTLFLFALLNVTLGEVWTQGVRVTLIRLLFYVSWVCCLPLQVLLSILSLSPARAFALPKFQYGPSPLQLVMKSLRPQPTKLLLFMGRLVIAEEFVYRWGFRRLWYYLGTRESAKDLTVDMATNEEENPNDDAGGHESQPSPKFSPSETTSTCSKVEWSRSQCSWIFWSSMVFVVIHFTNFLPGLSPQMIEEEVTATRVKLLAEDPHVYPIVSNWLFPWVRFLLYHGPLIACLLQSVAVFVTAHTVYAPMFLKQGLMASIGAHMYWNLSVFLLWPQLVLRWLWKIVCKIKKGLVLGNANTRS